MIKYNFLQENYVSVNCHSKSYKDIANQKNIHIDANNVPFH